MQTAYSGEVRKYVLVDMSVINARVSSLWAVGAAAARYNTLPALEVGSEHSIELVALYTRRQ